MWGCLSNQNSIKLAMLQPPLCLAIATLPLAIRVSVTEITSTLFTETTSLVPIALNLMKSPCLPPE